MAVPTVGGLDPASGPEGTHVLITGTGFTEDVSRVRFGSYDCGLNYTVISDTAISCIAPAGSGSQTCYVTNPDGTNGSGAAFTFATYEGGSNAVPTVTALSDHTAPGFDGESYEGIIITGTGFETAIGVYFGPTISTAVPARFARVSPTRIDCIGPRGEPGTTAYVFVENIYGVSTDADADNAYQYLSSAIPTVTSLTPNQMLPEFEIHINGTGFTMATGVRFGTLHAQFRIYSDVLIKAIVPGDPTFLGSSVEVYVSNPWGESTTHATFTYSTLGTLKTEATTSPQGSAGVGLGKNSTSNWIVTSGDVTVTLSPSYSGAPASYVESTWFRIDNTVNIKYSAPFTVDTYVTPTLGSHRLEYWSVGKDGVVEATNVGYINVVASTTLTATGTPAIGAVIFKWNTLSMPGVRYEVYIDASATPTTLYTTTSSSTVTYQLTVGVAPIYMRVRAVAADGTTFSYSTAIGPFSALQSQATDLADDAIMDSLLAVNIVPPRVVATLPAAPTADIPVGSTCVWTWDNKLYRYGAANAFPIMTANNAPSGTITTSSEYSTTYQGWKALNHTVGTTGTDCWITANGTNTGTITYDFGAGVTKIAKQYAITTRCGSTNVGAPKTWDFYGSNDGSTWIGLDSQIDVTDWANWQAYKKVFDCSANTTAFRYYRLDVTDCNLVSYLAIAEWEISEAASPEVGWSTATDGKNIEANSIIAGTIAAGAIGATEIAADSIFVRQLVVTDFENLIQNSNSEKALPPGVDLPVSYASAEVEYRGVTDSTYYRGSKCRVRAGTTSVTNAIVLCDPVPCRLSVPNADPALADESWYHARAWVKTSSGTAGTGARLAIIGLDANNGYVNSAVSSWVLSTTWTQVGIDYEVTNASVVSLALYFQVLMDTGQYGYMDEVLFRRKANGKFVVEGSILGDHIAATQTITSPIISAGTISGGTITGTTVNVESDLLVGTSTSAGYITLNGPAGTPGVFRSKASGDRIEIYSTAAGYIDFQTDNTSQLTRGRFYILNNGSNIYNTWVAPRWNNATNPDPAAAYIQQYVADSIQQINIVTSHTDNSTAYVSVSGQDKHVYITGNGAALEVGYSASKVYVTGELEASTHLIARGNCYADMFYGADVAQFNVGHNAYFYGWGHFDGNLYTDGSVKTGDFASGTSDDGIWIQDATNTTWREKIYWYHGGTDRRLYVRYDSDTYSYFTADYNTGW